MKCPFKFGRYKFEGGEECHKDCAWRLTYEPAPSGIDVPTVSSCAVAIIAQEANNIYGIRFDEEGNVVS